MIRPYYHGEHVHIYHGDCREILPQLEIGRSAVTITDPPYEQTSLAWDRWATGWPTAVPTDCLWTFGTLRMFLRYGHEFAAARFHLAQDLVWEKHNGSSMHADRFRRVHEQIAQFYRGAWRDQHKSVPVTNDARAKVVRRKERPPHMGIIAGTTYTSVDGGPRLRRSVLPFRSLHGKATHRTEKPVDLLALLVEFSAPAGTLIVDPFCGSGAALEAAFLGGCPAIGIDLNEADCEGAARRVMALEVAERRGA